MRTMLQRLTFSNAAATQIVDNEGVTSLDIIKDFSDDEVTSLCRTVRSPGGYMNNPNAGQPGQPDQIANRGTPISTIAEKNLKLLAYWLQFMHNTSRTIAIQDVQANNNDVAEITGFKRRLDKWEDPTSIPDDIIDKKDWRKTFERIDELLRQYMGVQYVPLAYLTREDGHITDDPDGGWQSKEEELIGRCPIYVDANADPLVFTDDAASDNHKLWEVLADICNKKECWTYCKVGQRTRDGRRAYLALKEHYLGPNAVGNAASAAEAAIRETTYSGESRRWGFEQTATKLKDNFEILNGMKDQGHAGIDPASQVRTLLAAIKTDKLDAVKLQVNSNVELRNDFDKTVSLFKEFIGQNKAMSGGSSLHIAEVTTDKYKGKKHGGYQGNGERKIQASEVEDRYYKRSEYKRFTEDAKLKLKRLRQKRGHDGRDGGRDEERPSKKQRKFDRQVSALTTALQRAGLVQPGANNDEDAPMEVDDGASAETQQVTNATNPALQNGRRRGGR